MLELWYNVMCLQRNRHTSKGGTAINITPGIIFAIILMFSFYGGINYYIARKIYLWLCSFSTNLNVYIYTGTYILLALSMFLAFLPIPSSIKRVFSYISSHWMVIFVYLLLFFLASDLVVLLGRLTNLIPTPIPQSVRFCAGLVVVLLTTGFVSYGLFNANQIKYVSYDIGLKEKTLFPELKIVLISDLHLGAVNSEKNLSNIIQGINNLNPDIVCIAGDIFNDDLNALRNPSGAIDLFKSITPTYGTYACLGNHDGGKTFQEMIHFLEQSNIKLLNDEYVTVDERLVLIGRVDPSPIGGFGGLERKEITDIITSIDTSLPVVVMDHNPSNIKQYGKEVDLILAGHTHQGQIFPGNLITNAIFTVDYGYYRKNSDSPRVIVTSGAGTWGMPMRIGTNNEIVTITLRQETQE